MSQGMPSDLGRAWRGDVSVVPRPRYGWWQEAECATVDSAPWFPLGVNGPQTLDRLEAQYADAKAVCDVCPVAADCLRAALIEEGGAATNIRFGMRGGMRPDERHTEWELLSDAHYRGRQREAS